MLRPLSFCILDSFTLPGHDALAAFLRSLPEAVAGLYIWTVETIHAEAAVHARCFCPNAGLPEDPVTGTACGALGAYLTPHALLPTHTQGTLTFVVEQGHGSVGVVIQREAGAVTGVHVRGRAVLIAEGTLWA